MAIPATWLTWTPQKDAAGETAYNSPVTDEAAPSSAPEGASGEAAPPGEVAPPASSSASAKGQPRGFTGAPVTGALVAVNVGVFAAQVYLAGGWGYLRGMPDSVLRWLGANASLWTISDTRLETLVTSCFLHSSILHLFINMLVLWQVGPLLERADPMARFFPLYLASGIVAGASSAIMGRFFAPTVSFGASGALCGIVAAAIVVGVRTEGWRGELAIGMGRWLALFVLVGLVRVALDRSLFPGIAQIDNAAHIGGALGGAVVATTWQRGFTYEHRAQRTVIAVCIGIVLAAGATVYVRNRTDPYLYMNVDERMQAAYSAFQAGHCDRARIAMDRAIQMDPKNRFIRAGGDEISRECSDPNSDRPSPRLRK
jgi:rhomboid protease GluP